MSSLYEVSSLFLLIMNKPNIFGQVLGILTKGNKIDVISVSGSWAYFKYNNNNAYVKKNSLKIINNTPVEEIGSVTIKFLNSDTNDEVYASQTINDLSFGTYTYNAKEIYGYKLNSTTPQYITLTNQNPNQTVIFYYTKISCSITIHYINENTNEYISDSKTITDLSLGSYSYDSIEINGYSLDDDQTKTVTLTESNPNATISFKYKEILGSVVIKYLSNLNSDELLPSETINNLKLGEYTYKAKFISGYAILNSSTQTVTLTSSNPNVEITFKYTKLYGSVTIKYIDETSEKSVANNDQYSNLEFGSYSYNSKSIPGYKLISSNTQIVIIDDTNLNQVVTFKYSKILGNITIKYLDKDSLSELSGDNVLTNIELGSYTFDAIHISNYSVYGDLSKTIILTDDNPNAKIEFLYSEILGSITIKYIDNSTNLELASEDVYNNLKLGAYTYSSKAISSYAVVGDSSKTISLTEDNTSVTITFEYEKVEIEIPDDINWNEVPYISTYYIKPVVKPGEEVLIDYYITDYYYKEYMEKYNLKEDTWGDDNWTEEVWNNEIFTVTVRIEGQEDKIYPNLKAGDHQVSLGIFSTEGEQKFSILCTDKYGRNSHELFNFFLVQNDVEVKEYVMIEDDLITYNIKNTDDYEEKIYVKVDKLTDITTGTKIEEVANATIVPSKKYICFIGTTETDVNGNSIMQTTPARFWLNTIVKYASDYDKNAVLIEATNTRTGLQKLLDDKKAAGYNKLLLLPGIYRIDHQGTIFVPDRFTLDMNGATLKENQFTGDSSLMISLDGTFDSHIINGTIEGDYFSHDYTNSTNNSEWCMGISISGACKYSSFENINIKDITGYGGGNGISKKSGYTYFAKPLGNTFKLGDISTIDGSNMTSTQRQSTDFIDISNYVKYDYIAINRYLGYQGILGGSWNLILHFYDNNKNYIRSTSAFQYRRARIPSNSYFMKVTILSPTASSDFWMVYFKMPCHCNFTNIEFNNCRCVGLAQSAMNDMLVHNCSFTLNGQSGAFCAYDAEDGWDQMQDVTIKNCNFINNYRNDFLTCAGHNFIIENIINGNIHFWARTNSYVVRNCSNLSGAYLGKKSRELTGYVRFYNNTIKNNIKIDGDSNYKWQVSVKDCIINGKLETTTNQDSYVRCNIGGSLTSNDSIANMIGGATFINCYIFNRATSHNYGGSYYNCTIENLSGSLQNAHNYYNCTFTNFVECPVDNSIINMYNCTLINSTLTLSYWQKGATILIDSCTINNTTYLLRLPHYSMKKPITITENEITSETSSGLIIFYDDRTGGLAGELITQALLDLNNNTIILSNSSYIISGISKSTVNNININFKDNIVNPDSILLCNPTAYQNPNIFITK